MIPRPIIIEWRSFAPWVEDFMVEQDLIMSRALVELYRQPKIRETLAFRGGTSLHKLFIQPPARYSEDLDFVHVKGGPIGETLDAVRAALSPWLGEPKWKMKSNRVVFSYYYLPEGQITKHRLKIEINSVENFCVYGLVYQGYAMNSSWFSGDTEICTYELDELLATKLRALYQRKKGRDLFDIWLASQRCDISTESILSTFHHYLEQENKVITRAQFERNLHYKLQDDEFGQDIQPLLARDIYWDVQKAIAFVNDTVIAKLSGEPWKGEQ